MTPTAAAFLVYATPSVFVLFPHIQTGPLSADTATAAAKTPRASRWTTLKRAFGGCSSPKKTGKARISAISDEKYSSTSSLLCWEQSQAMEISKTMTTAAAAAAAAAKPSSPSRQVRARYQTKKKQRNKQTAGMALLSIAALFAHTQACLVATRRLQAHTAAAAPRARPARRPARQTRNRTRRPARNTRTHRAHRKPRANQRRRRSRTARNTTGLERVHTKRNANPKRAAHSATRTHTHRPFQLCILRRAVRGRRARRVGQ